ncbi:MAG: matrixin family metalloprotease [Polyangiaceae bacterium]
MLCSRLISVALLALPSLCAGCFYDSTWGARKTAQAHNAAVATPAPLAPQADPKPATTSDEATPSDGVTTLRVRVHATPTYAAQTPDWKAHVGDLLAGATATLQASVGARLVLESADDWERPAPARLDAELAALRDEDTGDGVDLVLGLVGGLSMATEDFEQAGMSEVGGKHLVVRAPNVAREYDAVEKAFDQLSVAERTRLRRARIRHREVAVLLHEIGHALGASHQTLEGSLMRPTYDPKMSGFDAESIERMRRKLSGAAAASSVVTTGAVAAKPPESAPATPASTGPVAGVNAKPPVKDDAPRELGVADREVWQHVAELLRGGDANEAWEAARPLFKGYPRVYAVQDLRCKLAMAHFASYGDARAECEPLMKLSLDPGKSGKRR